MPDVFTKTKRSYVMSRIRSHGNRDTEIALIKFLRANKISGWRRKLRLQGNPDFVFKSHRIAVFVDGCFWHGCLKHSRPPKSNQSYWTAKIHRNKQRDRAVTRVLRSKGWSVLRIWEHELSRKNESRLLRRIQKSFCSQNLFFSDNP